MSILGNGFSGVTQGITKNDNGTLRVGNRIPQPTPPKGEVIGDVWYNTSISALQVWNGTAWVGVASGGVGNVVTPGIELYHPSSTPYIDFHRAADPAGDGNADYSARIINDVNGQLRIFGELRTHSQDANGETFIGGWGGGGNYSMFGSAARKTANAQHYVILCTGDDGLDDNTYISPAGVGGGTVFRRANNGVDMVRFNNADVEILNGSGAVKHKFWDDGEIWCNSIGTGIADNPNNSGIFFNGGNLNLNFSTIFFRDNNNNNHRMYYTGGIDGVEIRGYQTVGFVRDVTAWTLQFGSSGLYTNIGWGLDTGGTLNSAVFGAASGGTLRSKSNGNMIRFDWTGAFQMWVDVTHVKTFVIDHPVDATKHLVHGTLEGPEAGVYYRGQSQLENGWVQIDLPDYFEALTKEEGRSVQLTCIADNPLDEWCPVLHATYPKNGKFWVGLGSGMVINDQKFWWEVKAVRKDVDPLEVEPLRSSVEVGGTGPYTFIKKKKEKI